MYRNKCCFWIYEHIHSPHRAVADVYVVCSLCLCLSMCASIRPSSLGCLGILYLRDIMCVCDVMCDVSECQSIVYTCVYIERESEIMRHTITHIHHTYIPNTSALTSAINAIRSLIRVCSMFQRIRASWCVTLRATALNANITNNTWSVFAPQACKFVTISSVRWFAFNNIFFFFCFFVFVIYY